MRSTENTSNFFDKIFSYNSFYLEQNNIKITLLFYRQRILF
jgi:hypothetical protein